MNKIIMEKEKLKVKNRMLGDVTKMQGTRMEILEKDH